MEKSCDLSSGWQHRHALFWHKEIACYTGTLAQGISEFYSTEHIPHGLHFTDRKTANTRGQETYFIKVRQAGGHLKQDLTMLKVIEAMGKPNFKLYCFDVDSKLWFTHSIWV